MIPEIAVKCGYREMLCSQVPEFSYTYMYLYHTISIHTRAALWSSEICLYLTRTFQLPLRFSTPRSFHKSLTLLFSFSLRNNRTVLNLGTPSNALRYALTTSFVSLSCSLFDSATTLNKSMMEVNRDGSREDLHMEGIFVGGIEVISLHLSSADELASHALLKLNIVIGDPLSIAILRGKRVALFVGGCASLIVSDTEAEV